MVKEKELGCTAKKIYIVSKSGTLYSSKSQNVFYSFHSPIFPFLTGVCLFELCDEKSQSKYC